MRTLGASTTTDRETQTLQRLQGIFTVEVRSAYGGACAVTGEHSAPVPEAAHMKPHSKGGEDLVNNGILLRSDLHRLYDRGYMTVTQGYVFRVGDRLRQEYKNGRSYYALSGSKSRFPETPLVSR